MVLRQLVELIPPHLVPKLAQETGADRQARTFCAWSHVMTMFYAQVSHALGLNDVGDALRLQVSALWAVRGAHAAGTEHAQSCQQAPRLWPE